jgi:hypothetical protein
VPEFLLFWGWIIFHYYPTLCLCIYPSVDTWWICLLAIVTNAALNVNIYISLYVLSFNFLGTHLKTRIDRSYGAYIFNFLVVFCWFVLFWLRDIAQDGLRLVGSSDPHASASWVTRITNTWYHTWLYLLFRNHHIVFHSDCTSNAQGFQYLQILMNSDYSLFLFLIRTDMK